MRPPSWLPPAFLERRLAKRHQRLAIKSTPEQQEPRRVFAFEQKQRLRELPARSISITGAPRQQTQMQSGHCKCRIEVGSGPMVLAGAVATSRVLPTERQNVMCPCIALVDQEQP
jgi:hypothetical protein